MKVAYTEVKITYTKGRGSRYEIASYFPKETLDPSTGEKVL